MALTISKFFDFHLGDVKLGVLGARGGGGDLIKRPISLVGCLVQGHSNYRVAWLGLKRSGPDSTLLCCSPIMTSRITILF